MFQNDLINSISGLFNFQAKHKMIMSVIRLETQVPLYIHQIKENSSTTTMLWNGNVRTTTLA